MDRLVTTHISDEKGGSLSLSRLYYGVDYYPEHRSVKEYQDDLKLLSEAGISAVRMGEFAWHELEPKEGEFRFEWMEKAINDLGERGIFTVLCTPTASPPVWLSHKYPETVYQPENGVQRPYGARRHYCPSNPKYLELSYIIAGKMAEHFKNNPYIVGWHIDNELAQESTGRCKCDG